MALGNSTYDSRGDCNAIIETATNKLCTACKNTLIPENIESIGEAAFYGLKNYTGITLPESVTTIEKDAFRNCENLTIVDLPMKLSYVGETAFWGCNLKSLVIPASVEHIGQGAFGKNRGLSGIYVEEGNKIYDSRGNCNAIVETLPNTIIQGSKNTIIPIGITNIGNQAFIYIHIDIMSIPEGVVSIGEEAFSTCGLNGLTLPKSIKAIGNNAFFGV